MVLALKKIPLDGKCGSWNLPVLNQAYDYQQCGKKNVTFQNRKCTIIKKVLCNCISLLVFLHKSGKKKKEKSRPSYFASIGKGCKNLAEHCSASTSFLKNFDSVYSISG